MKLFTHSPEYRGFWSFSDKKNALPFTSRVAYLGFYEDLYLLLCILQKHQLLIPPFKIPQINRVFESTSIENIVAEIRQLDYVSRFDLTGCTVIFTESGIEQYQHIFTIAEFLQYEKDFCLTTRSDIWLPMACDEDCFSNYVWNLERYKLNYHRIEAALNEVRSTLNWEDDSYTECDHYLRGNIQLGYRMFLSEQTIKQEYEDNPNSAFDLEGYLADIHAQRLKLNAFW